LLIALGALKRVSPLRFAPVSLEPLAGRKGESLVGKASHRKKSRGSLPIDLQPNARKVSTRLAELISPHVVAGEPRESYEALVALGAMAWNISVLPEQERGGLTREAVRRAAAQGIPLTDQWLNELIERKISLFPADDRFIESYEE
jgi:hypothetical protein